MEKFYIVGQFFSSVNLSDGQFIMAESVGRLVFLDSYGTDKVSVLSQNLSYVKHKNMVVSKVVFLLKGVSLRVDP